MLINRRNNFSFQNAFFGVGGLVFLLTLTILFVGVSFIYSASYHPRTGNYLPYAKKQIMWIFIVSIPFAIIVYTNYATLVKNAEWIYALGIMLLLVTLVGGTVRGGARRWLKLGPVMFQTSDFMKLAMIIFLAKILSNNRTQNFTDLFFPFMATFFPMGLILLQPDMGTSLVFIPILFAMTFVSGTPIRHLALIIIVLANLGILFGIFGLKEYQRSRIMMFIHQDQMTQQQKRGEGYHLVQSKIAHGAGGLVGKGYQKGTQNRYGFLPERHTDFIFSVVGEELGFFGTSLLLLVYILFFCSMLICAYTVFDLEGQLIIVGVTTLLAFQTFVNTAMTVGFAPITGLPLPFMSYGGTSLLFSSLGVALILSVKAHKFE